MASNLNLLGCEKNDILACKKDNISCGMSQGPTKYAAEENCRKAI